MTFEPDMITEAQNRLRAAVTLSEKWMPKNDGVMGALRGIVGGGSNSGGNGPGGSLTPVQLEGVLINAESSLVLGLLNLMEESIMALVRCGLSVRSGWRSIQLCDK